MIKAILFDLDNTLIDFMTLKQKSCEAAIDAMIAEGLDMKRDETLKILFDLYREYGIEYQMIFQKFLKKVSGSVDYKKLAYAIVAYRNARTGFLHPYAGTRETLMKLKARGLKLAVVSDAPKLKAWIRLVNMKIDQFFDVVVALEDTGRRKPSVMPFKAALRKLKVKASSCLMVGDWPERDLLGAKKLGMKTCFAAYGYEQIPNIKTKKENVKADYVVESITELARIV